MTVKLRDYQEAFLDSVFSKPGNVLGVMPTGAGKSICLGTYIKRLAQPTCVMVHRGELVAQLSETLALLGIYHRVIASKTTVQMCVSRHVRKFGKSFVNEGSPVGVASVQTLVKRGERLSQWIHSVRLVVTDEGHHYVDNQFGTAVKLFKNAKVFGVTATPDRCDRKSLARSQGGIFDHIAEGPSPRWLIEEGYLAPYRYIAPPPSIDMSEDDISPNTGEYRATAVRKKSHESRIIGDVVKTYMEMANGTQAIAFFVDIESAKAAAKAFNDVGIPASCVSGKTPDSQRIAIMDKFEKREIRICCNVDLYDEGVDIPGVETVIMARPTMSLGKFRQQIGRALRPVYADGFDLSTKEGRLAAIAAGPKPKAILIDHVSNYKPHKLPDSHRIWQLEIPEGGRKSRKADDEIPMTTCTNPQCAAPYERIHSSCPHCGHKPEPAERSAPEHVDGDLVEFGPELLAKLRGEVSRVDGAPQVPHGASQIVQRSIEKKWSERQEAQAELRHTIAVWAGSWRDKGASDSESYRRFYHTFGLDVLSAMALGKSEAETLTAKIQEKL